MFLLILNSLDVNFVQKCQKCQICVSKGKLECHDSIYSSAVLTALLFKWGKKFG